MFVRTRVRTQPDALIEGLLARPDWRGAHVHEADRNQGEHKRGFMASSTSLPDAGRINATG